MRTPRTRRSRSVGAALLGCLAVAATAAVAVPVTTAPPARAAEPVVLRSSTFEDDTTQGWASRADEVVAVSTAAAHTGTRSLLVSGRTQSWQGPAVDLLDDMTKGTRYTLSVWVQLAAGESPAPVRLSVERRTEGTSSYDQVVGNTTVTSEDWVNLHGTYTLAHDVDLLAAYLETGSGTASLHIDDFSLSYLPLPPVQTDIPAVRAVLAEHFPIGAAISPSTIIGNHAQLLTRHFNSVTPGNALKWDATEPTEGTFRFTDADAMVDFARDNDMSVRGHTLVWHNQTPAWVFTDADGNPMTPTEANRALLLSRLDRHIREVVGRYGTDIGVWDVVNEVIDENQSDGLRRSRWYEIAGLDYIRTAFRVAREVAPGAKLYINDYNTNVPAKRDHLFNLVSQLRAEGVPIDGVGHQMHVNVDWPSAAETEAMITKFVPLGVDQQITEMDISIYVDEGEAFPAPPRDRLVRQGYRYRDLFDVYRRHASEITSVTLWGLADDDTWLDTFPVARKDAPLLFDTQLQAKPAYWGIVDPSRIEATPSPTPTHIATPTATPTPTRTATPTPTGASPSGPATACRVAYAVPGQWGGGFQGEVRITNTGTVPINAWALRWSFGNGQRLSQVWNGSYTQTGATVTVSHASWNAMIPPGGSTGFGFLATWTGSNTAPTAFTLNDSACAVG